jgi:hypothetical protein
VQGDICPGDLAPLSKMFLVVFAFTGLGFFCGPLMDVASTWTRHVPGGTLALGTVTIGIGVLLFTTLEGISETEAIYASVIAGTCNGTGYNNERCVRSLHSINFATNSVPDCLQSFHIQEPPLGE